VLLLIYAVKCRIKHSRQKPQNNILLRKERKKERSRTKKTKKKDSSKSSKNFLHFFFLLFEGDIKMGVTPSVSLATVKPPKTPFVLRKTAAPRRRNILSSWSSSFPPFPFRRKNPEKIVSVRRSSSSGTPKRSAGKKIIRVEKNRRKEEFQNWPVWGCAQSTFPWTYGQTEQCYILKGKVTVIPDENPEEAVTLEAGDFAEMQKGLSCTWDVLEDVSKNFKFV
jgi:uncharacterized cupin superfamily protein